LPVSAMKTTPLPSTASAVVAIGVPIATFHVIDTRLGKGVRAFMFA
jgi:hypothetical protein